MKKLLQINSVVNYGSTGKIVEEIGESAITFGWESYIAFGRNDRESASHKIKIGDKWNIIHHGMESRLLDNHGLASYKSTKAFIEEVRKIQPGVIHLHNLHGYYLNIEVLFDYLAATDIPVVWTFHDCWPITGHCAHFTFAECEKWETECFQCPQKREYPASFLLDQSRRNFQLKRKLFTSVKNMTIVTVSDWLNGIVKRSFLKDYPVITIHNGINTEIFKPAVPSDVIANIKKKYGIPPKFIILGVSSVWAKRKGLADFIELSGHLLDDSVVVLVGLTQKQIKGLPGNIIGIPRTENVQELASLYSAADVLVNPTWEDNFPTTNLEALGCGTPIVTYNTGGSIEAVSPDTGFIVEQGDICGLLTTINEVRDKGKAKYNQACRQRALDYYRKEDRYAEYLELYEKWLKV